MAALRQDTGLAAVYGRLANVTVEEDVQALVDAAEGEMGGVDILINNAGLGGTRLLVEMADEVEPGAGYHAHRHHAHDPAMLGKCSPAARGDRQQCLRAGLARPERTVPLRRGQGRGDGWTDAARRWRRRISGCASTRCHLLSPSRIPEKTTRWIIGGTRGQRKAFGRAAEVWEVANVMMFLAGLLGHMTGEIVSCSSQRA